MRIGNYEEGVTGRHDAARVLTPFIESILSRAAAEARRRAPARRRIDQQGRADAARDDPRRHRAAAARRDGVLRRHGAARRAIHRQPAVRGDAAARRRCARSRQSARAGGFDYVILFESSGMYRGEDIVGLASHLAIGRLDAVWGSRRLSIRDIEESYRLRYRPNAVLGAISYAGSHVLSLAYLVFYGRYISDTLSAVRAVRAADAFDPAIDLDAQAGQSPAALGAAAAEGGASSRFRCSSFRSRPSASSARARSTGCRRSARLSGGASRRRGRRRSSAERGVRPEGTAVRPAAPRAVMSTTTARHSRRRPRLAPGRRRPEGPRAGRRRADARSTARPVPVSRRSRGRGGRGPSFDSDVKRHVAARPDHDRIDCVVQASPTGMLDAILLAMPIVERHGPASVWVTWCDQVAVHPRTIERLGALTGGNSARPRSCCRR